MKIVACKNLGAHARAFVKSPGFRVQKPRQIFLKRSDWVVRVYWTRVLSTDWLPDHKNIAHADDRRMTCRGLLWGRPGVESMHLRNLPVSKTGSALRETGKTSM